jgi:hypothetical protein
MGSVVKSVGDSITSAPKRAVSSLGDFIQKPSLGTAFNVLKSPLGFGLGPIGGTLASADFAGRATGIGSLDDIFDKVGGAFKSPKDIELKAHPIAKDIFATQKEAMKGQREALARANALTRGGAARDFAQRITTQKLRNLTGQGEDARRRLQESIARRGLGSSSLGLGQERGLEQSLSRQRGDIIAQMPLLSERERERRMRAFSDLAGDIVRSQNLPVRLQDTTLPGGVSPALSGLLGLGGALVGGKLGGSQGAGVGAGVGKGLAGLFGGF